MVNDTGKACFELIWAIVNFGKGSKVMQEAKKCGISGGTILLAKGTAKGVIADFLGLSDIRKEIVLMGSDKMTARPALEALNKKFEFEKAGHGIIFTVPVSEMIGSVGCRPAKTDMEEGGESAVHCAIMVIVDRGKAEKVIDAATEAGSKGGTVINARGSGIHETSRLFFMEIEPEKEIVLIISDKDAAETIIASIREKMEIDKPGKGIIFVQEVSRAYGLAR